MQNLYQKYGNQVRIHPVEIFVSDTSGRYFLPDDSILRNETIIGLSTPAPQYDAENSVDIVLNSPETDRPLIIRDAFFNAYLSLYNNNVQIIYQHPLSYYGVYVEDKDVQQIYTTSFTPSKSFVTIAAPATVGRLTAGQSIYLNFFYLGSSIN